MILTEVIALKLYTLKADLTNQKEGKKKVTEERGIAWIDPRVEKGSWM